MRVHHDSGRDPITGTEHHVRRLACRPGDTQHLFHGLRHLPAEFVDHALRGADDGLGLVIEEPGAAYVIRQHLRTHRGEIAWRGVLGEEAGRDFVHALIGALRRQNGSHQEFRRIVMEQRAGGAGDRLGYHLFNLMFHLAAVLLAWECLRRVLPERAALIAGLIFALHPIQSEAVNYVWARSIVLASLCCFGALWQWLSGRPWVALRLFAAGLPPRE